MMKLDKCLGIFSLILWELCLAGGDFLLSNDPTFWDLSLGREFPGAAGKLENHDGALVLSGDFSGGGRYVGSVTSCELPDFRELRFRVKGAGKRVTVRFQDSGGQTHQFSRALSGNADEWQLMSWPVTGSVSHWGGANDGKVRGKIKKITFVLHAGDEPGSRGELLFRDITLRQVSNASRKFIALPERLDKHFVTPGSQEPIRLKLFGTPIGLTSTDLACHYTDYVGEKIFSGHAEYLPEEGAISLPVPPRPGYYDLTLPALKIHTSVVVDRPAIEPADDYFGIDVALTRGGFSPSRFDELFHILHKNNILYFRDRFTHATVEPEEGRFNFEAHSGRYRLLRTCAARAGLKLLDVFHDTPDWNRRLVSAKDGFIVGGDSSGNYSHGSNLYPRNLLKAAAGLDTLTACWDTEALEVWNEPNIIFGNSFPGEFVTALTKAVSLRFSLSGNPAQIVGGVFAGTPLGFYESYIANGLLDYCDAISFRNYTQVEPLEEEIYRLREIEKKSGTPKLGIPYWVTECGMPWPRGGNRALSEDDRYSTSEIVGKAIEYRALGIKRYYAFTYKFYNERRNNFGMMDADGTPMRSMAAYAHLVRVLSGKNYLGDVKMAGVSRSRVFGNAQEQVICLYAPLRPEPPSNVLVLPKGLEVLRAEGIDGRVLDISNGISIRKDGVVYLYVAHLPEHILDRNTRAMELYRLAHVYKPVRRSLKPIVIQPDYALTGTDYNESGIILRAGESFRCRVLFYNFSAASVSIEPFLTLPEGVIVDHFPGKPFELKPEEVHTIEFTLSVQGSSGLLRAPVVIGERNNRATPLQLVLSQPPFQGAMLNFKLMGQATAWRKNSSGKMVIRRSEEENALEFCTVFPEKVDRWSYPEFVFPPEQNLKNAIALEFDVKISPVEKIRQMLLMGVFTEEKEHGTSFNIKIPLPTGNNWERRCIVLPAHIPGEKIRQLRLGVNALTDQVSVKIRNVRIFYAE